MSISLGKIVSSDSHILYQARVHDASEIAQPPTREDFAFGTFVKIESFDANFAPTSFEVREEDKEKNIGVIVNSRLINPEHGYFGPHLSVPHYDTHTFTPDYLNEFGVLISILLLGELHQGYGHQEIPSKVLPIGSSVQKLDEPDILKFHRDARGRLQLRYYPLLGELGSAFAVSLLRRIIERLLPSSAPHERRLLAMLKKNAVWQESLGSMKS